MFMNLQLILFYGTALGFAAFLSICIILIATSKVYPTVFRSKKEKFFIDPSSGKSIQFPSIQDASSLHLSVVIPAYNEEVRLTPMLDECIEFLENRCETSNFRYEIIVVSDGSKDDTVKVAQNYCKKLGSDRFRILDLQTNRGKGGAVRLGVQSCRGSLILFADADGATKFADLEKLEAAMKELIQCDYVKYQEEAEIQTAMVIGSRAHLQDDAIATRSLFRTILMYGFHFLVWLFTVRNIKDTQCGFKLFTRKAAYLCFESIHVERWAFDVELLYIAQTLKIPIKEVAVNWTEIEGSKLTPIWSAVQMGRDLALIWLRYKIGAWKILKSKNE